MYVKVTNGKEKWAKLAEQAIGFNALDRFIVTNQSDLKLMDRLRKEVGCRGQDCALYRIHPNGAERKYNVPAPPEGVETVTSVLSVDSPSDDDKREGIMAFNFLVDSKKIDTSALTDSKDGSERALLVRNGGKSSIRGGKIRKVFFFPKGDHWDVNKGDQAVWSNDKPLKQTVGVDRSRAIESAKHEMKAMQQELARNKSEEKAVKEASFKAKKLWNEAQKEYRTVDNKIKKMEELLDRLKAEAETSEEPATIDTTEFEADIQNAEEAVQDLKKQEAAITREIESLKPNVEDKEKQLGEVTARNNKILSDMDKLDAKLEDIVKGQALRQAQVDKVKAKVEQVESALLQQEEVVRDIKGKVGEAQATARQMQFAATR